MPAESGVIDVTRLRVALARLSRRLRRHSPAGLTPTQLAALSTVEQNGPLRLGDLAAAEGIAPSTLTRMVAVLEDLGYVRRDADPRDARASTLAGIDVGQSVAIADRACVAIEAMEGTDAMLRRAASLVDGKPLRLVKASRRRKHMLFDVPVAGPQTIDIMRETGTSALAIDATRTLLIDRDEILARADAAGIAIASYLPEE